MDTQRKKLVLLAGQSNMAGRGYATKEDLLPIDNVEMIRPDFKWQMAIEPVTKDRAFIGTFSEDGKKIESNDPFETVMPQEGQKVCGVGLGRTFAKYLSLATDNSVVGLIPTAVGGTPIASWQIGGVDTWDKDKKPYDDAILLAKEAQKVGDIVAILWHQGETDAMNQNQNYLEEFRTVIRNFRRDLNLSDDIPFIAGNLASFYNPEIADYINLVDDALVTLKNEEHNFDFVDTKDLTHRGDNLHFDTQSLHILGKRYFDKYIEMTKK
jgi:hypothetical protein